MEILIRQRKRMVIIMLATVAALSGIGCARMSAAKKNGRIVIGFSQMENNGPWRIAETASMKNEAAKRADKYELVVTDAQGQTSKQVSDVEDLIARGVTAIFLAPREFEGLGPVIREAKEANIPVFLIDRLAEGVSGKDYVSFIGSDFVTEGRRAAEWLVRQTRGRANIVELTGTAGASVAQDRHDGFVEGIRNYPEMKIIASQTADFTRSTGQKVMENILQSKGKEITAVYTHNDEMALGAITALKAAGLAPNKDVIVVSVDGEKAALEAIIRGDMGATVECNPRFGPRAFDALDKYLRGEEVPTRIVMEDHFFDASNAGQFVNEAY